MATKISFEKSFVSSYNYKIMDTLSESKLRWVFSAVSTVDQIEVAIKVFYSTQKNERCRSENERDILKLLSHANVVQYIDYINLQNGFNCLVIELSPFGDLRKYQDEKIAHVVPLVERRSIMQQLAAAISYIHGRGIVHSDIKPRNVLVFENLLVKLCDFESAATFTRGAICELTRYTTGYVAPERLKTKRLLIPDLADVYSLGAVHRSMITGTFPNEGKNRVRLRGSCSEADLVRAMLIFDPPKRITVDQIILHPFFCETKEEREK